jgi:hypothetical protein
VAPSAAKASSTKSVFGVLFYSGSVFKISNKTFFLIWLSLRDAKYASGWWRSFSASSIGGRLAWQSSHDSGRF